MDDKIQIKDLDQGAPGAADWLVFQKVSDGVVYKAPKSDIEGHDAYVYIGYADDAIGTGFTLTFNASKDYIAILSTDTEIPSPVVGDFAGLWKKYKGETGETGNAATIAVGNVTTVDPSDPATVTNSGDEHNAVFDFEIPQGEKGACVVSVAFVGDDMVFTLEDASTITLIGAKSDLKGDQGDTGASIIFGAFVGNDIVFTKDDATTVTLVNGKTILTGPQGDAGKGITSITKTGTVGLVDTYTITYTDSTTSTFTVTNGAKGDPGDDGKGIVSVTLISTVDKVKTYRITFTDSTTFDYDVTDGADGEDGVGIDNITLISTVGKIKTYRITYTDATYFDYVVTDGADGTGVGDMLASIYDPTSKAEPMAFASDLANYEPLLPATPTDPTNNFLNGNKEWSKVVVGSGGFAGNVYLSDTDSDITGYKTLSYTLDASEVVRSVVVNNNTVLSETVLFGGAIETTLIPNGIWRSVFYVKVSNAVGDTKLSLTVFKRTSGGVETDLFTVDSEFINNTNDYALFRFESSQEAFTTNTTDRLGARINGVTTAGVNITINYIVGDGRGAYFNTPLQIRHQQLRDLNADTNYLHVTSTEKSGYDTAVTNSHTHTNKSVIDDISATDLTNWDTAYTNNHTHSNKSILDAIDATDISNWDGKITNPMTTQGDIIYGGASGVPTRLGKGTAGQVLKMNSGATAPEWGTINAGFNVGSTASSATPSIDVDTYNRYKITALAANITSVTITGTPTDFQELIIRIKDNGTARTIAWGSSFEAKGVALPIATVSSKVLTVKFIYDTVTSKWGCVAYTQEA